MCASAWLPKWLEWLPQVHVEGEAADFATVPAEAREPEPALGD